MEDVGGESEVDEEMEEGGGEMQVKTRGGRIT